MSEPREDALSSATFCLINDPCFGLMFNMIPISSYTNYCIQILFILSCKRKNSYKNRDLLISISIIFGRLDKIY